MSWTSAILTESEATRPFWPRRNWWLALLAILVLAGALRYPGYGFGLPFTENHDENIFALSGQMIIDLGTAKPLGHHHYPPGIISIYYLLLRFFHDPTSLPMSVIGFVRLLAITTSLGVIALLGLFGYHAMGESAGLLGAALWSISPFFVEWSRWGRADIFVAFFSVLALYLTFLGIRYRRGAWTTPGTYALLGATVFKYHVAFIAPVVLFAPLWGKRVSWQRVLANTGRFALFCVWLVLFTPFLDAFFPSGNFSNVSWEDHVRVSGIPDPLNILHNIGSAFAQFGWQYLFPGWLGLGLVFTARMRQRRALATLAFLGSALLLWVAGISFFGNHGGNAIRFLFTWVSLLIMLSGWGYALILHRLYRSLSHLPPQRRNLALGAVLALLIALQLPNVFESAEESWQAALPDQRNDLVRWADQTLRAGPFIANYANNRIFNREWGGYTGETIFQNVGGVYDDVSIQEWRAQRAHFAIMPHFQYELWREDGVHPYFTETTLLKSYPPSDAHRGPAMVVLLLQPIQHAATGQLGPIRLIGYDLAEELSQPGESLPFHLYWQATAATEADYQVFNHLLDADGNLVAQADGPPLPDPLLRRGTKDWHDPEEIIYSREYLLTLPENLTPGEYTLVTGFYRRDTGQRLLSPAGEDALWVTRIRVEGVE